MLGGGAGSQVRNYLFRCKHSFKQQIRLIVGVETDLEKTTKIPLFLRHSGVSIFERNPFLVPRSQNAVARFGKQDLHPVKKNISHETNIDFCIQIVL